MASEIEDIARGLRALANESGRPAQTLSSGLSRTRQMVGSSAALGPDGTEIAAQLQQAEQSIARASEALEQLRKDALRFANNLAR